VAGGAVIALALAFIAPRLSQFGLLAIPIWLRLAMGRAERSILRAYPER
jgi:hypothetical protein